MATARQDEVSIHVEDSGPLTVLQVLSMTVEELRFDLQARNLTPVGTAKPDVQQTLLAAVASFPPVQPAQAAAAPLTDGERNLEPLQVRETVLLNFSCSSVGFRSRRNAYSLLNARDNKT